MKKKKKETMWLMVVVAKKIYSCTLYSKYNSKFAPRHYNGSFRFGKMNRRNSAADAGASK